MKKYNLCFFTSSKYGLSHYVASLYKPAKKYFKPYFITYADGELDDLVENKVDKVHRLLENDNEKSYLDVLSFLQDNHIKAINIHIATTAKKHSHYFSFILRSAKAIGIKIIGTLHDVLPFEDHNADILDIEILYSNIDYYFVGTNLEKEKLMKYFKVPESKIDIIVHPPYLILNNDKCCCACARQKLNIPCNKKVILFFGNMRSYKGLEYLVEAFKWAVKKNPDALLYISTSLDYNPKYEDYINRISEELSDKIQVVKKYVEASEIETIFKAVDI